MKDLEFKVDIRNSTVLIPNRSDFITYHYNESTGSIAVPTGARFAEFTATSVEGWLKFGTANTVDATAPTTSDVTDGTAPAYLPVGVPTMFALDGATHFALRCSGGVSVRWWS